MAAKIVLIDDFEKWSIWRGRGVGASEGSVILNMNPFKPAITLFDEKVYGVKPFTNMQMLEGEEMEDFVSRQLESWGGDNQSHAYNMKNGIKHRNCEKYPKYAFVVNDDKRMEFCYVSPDRKFTWEAKGISGIAEIKNRSNSMIKNFDDGIYPPDLIQIRIQLLVASEQYGILAYRLTDYPKHYKEDLVVKNGLIWEDKYTGEKITEQDYLDKVNDFWHKVVKARAANEIKRQANLDFAHDVVAECNTIIESCQPDPDNSAIYEDYIKANYYTIAKPLVEVKGTEEHEALAESYLKAQENKKNAEAAFQLERNKVLSLCKTGMAIKLQGKGKIEVKQGKKAISINVKN